MIVDKNKRIVIMMCLYFAFQVNTLNVVMSNKENVLVLSILLGVLLIITAARHYYSRISGVKYLLPILELIILFSVSYFDITTKSHFLLIVVVADIVMAYAFLYSIAFSAIGYGVFLTIYLLKLEEINDDLIAQIISVSFVSYFSVLVIFFIIKNQILQNYKYKILMEQLIKKTTEVEELAVFKERSRIAGEIHDTVGHTLTTVLIEIEAGRMLIDQDPVLAKEKIAIAKEQVRKGLNDIRTSVKAIKKGEDLLGFKESIEALLKEMQLTTGSLVERFISIQVQLLPIQEKVIYYAIQEALTNGLKHGLAKQFHLKLIEEDGYIHLEISDDGVGTKEIQMGFGLTNMVEKVKSMGGKVQFESKPLKGFHMSMVIPIGHE